MRFISWNVNGIRAVKKRGDLDWLWDSDADVVCVQETKAQLDQLGEDITSPPGWRSEWVWGEKKGYSGVAVFVREEIDFKVHARGLGIEKFDREGRLIALDFEDFVLFNVYFPNGGRGPKRVEYKIEFYEEFQRQVTALVEAGREVVVCGDVNTAHRDIDLAQPEKNAGVSGCLPEERAWIDRFLDAGFIDTFRAEHGDRPDQYTWWDMRTDARPDNLGWRIDYFFISEGLEDVFVDAWISPHIKGSDHCPIGLELEL